MITTLVLGSTWAQADGLSDLKSALGRLQGQSPVKGVLDIKRWNKQGEGKEAEETNSQINVSIEDSGRGLQILYSKDLISKLEAEQRQKSKDKEAKTPVTSAISSVSANGIREMTLAASNLIRDIDRAKFKGETTETVEGKPLRKLSFEVPMESLSEKERKYLKKLDAGFDIWIAADGTPVSQVSHTIYNGRAFLVISFEQKQNEKQVYAVSGDRLVTIRHESSSSGSGAGEKGESRSVRTFQLQS
ncbi:hypothetical protein KSF73_07125 [Burkholderiaceae bacterium DAT-1]|nr:hypothetical protein [Burkholderiaceae bacterium DAT-1]